MLLHTRCRIAQESAIDVGANTECETAISLSARGVRRIGNPLSLELKKDLAASDVEAPATSFEIAPNRLVSACALGPSRTSFTEE